MIAYDQAPPAGERVSVLNVSLLGAFEPPGFRPFLLHAHPLKSRLPPPRFDEVDVLETMSYG